LCLQFAHQGQHLLAEVLDFLQVVQEAEEEEVDAEPL